MTDQELIQALTEAGNSNKLIRRMDYWALCCRKAAVRFADLQAENAEKDARIARVEAERDAAVEDLDELIKLCCKDESGIACDFCADNGEECHGDDPRWHCPNEKEA